MLDRLLEDETIEFAGVSGTSAGAINAAVMASGYARDGRAGARAALDAFWRDTSRSGSPFTPIDARIAGPFALDHLPGYQWVSSFWQSFSPYQFNPLNLNPLKDLLRRHVDTDALRTGPLCLFVTATSVQTGRARVFTHADLSLDALLASACLPHLFQAVEIDGEPYWDGGYTGNPALYPLIYDTEPLDLVLVRINPLIRKGTPRRNVEIMDRLAEITFNASLIGELRAIAFVARLMREGRLDPGRYKSLRLHMIADDAQMTPLGTASKMDTSLPFLEKLFGFGRHAAAKWLAAHRADIGVRPTLDIEGEFLA